MSHISLSWRYDAGMEPYEETGPHDPDPSPRRFPAWIQLSVIGLAALLIFAVVSGMFLY